MSILRNDIVSCAVREIKRRKSRALAGVLGYAMIVCLLTILIHLLHFSREAAQAVLEKTGVHFMAFIPVSAQDSAFGTSDIAEEAFVANSVITRLIPLSRVDEVRRIPTVKDASPFLVFRMRDSTDGELKTIGGFDPNSGEVVGATCCAPSDLTAGSFLSSGTSGVMLEEGFARGKNIRVGDVLSIAGIGFPVIGIVNPGIRPAKADIYLKMDDARLVIDSRLKKPVRDETNLILVEVTDSRYQETAIEATKALLGGSVVTTYNCFKPAVKVLGFSETATRLLIGLLVIGMTAFAIRNQMACVWERRRDIGILKAVGWTDTDIGKQLLLESLIVSFFGGILGAGAGSVPLFLTPLSSSAGSIIIVFSLVVAVIGGFVAGVFPIFMVIRMDANDIMKRL